MFLGQEDLGFIIKYSEFIEKKGNLGQDKGDIKNILNWEILKMKVKDLKKLKILFVIGFF